MRILHLADSTDWARALETGTYEQSSRGVTLQDEGFIHASTQAQAPGVLERYYADYPGELLLLVLDVAELEDSGSPVQWDDVPGQPQPFPHIYGPIRPQAAVAVLPVQDGRLPDLSGYDVAP